jgi:hypothetical protein
MRERSEGQTVVSVSLPVELLQEIDRRAESLGLARSQYIALLADKDLRQLGPLIIHGDQAKITQRVELTAEAYSFLLSAIPQMADFEQRLAGVAIPDLPPTPKSIRKSDLWQLFLLEQKEILKHKWIESEKVGYDIGIERAIRDWLQKHHEKWEAAQK